MSTVDSLAVENIIKGLNENDASMRQAVRHKFIGVHKPDEPDWFDFDDYSDDLPVAGFFQDKAIFQTKDGQWEARGPGELSDWKIGG